MIPSTIEPPTAGPPPEQRRPRPRKYPRITILHEPLVPGEEVFFRGSSEDESDGERQRKRVKREESASDYQRLGYLRFASTVLQGPFGGDFKNPWQTSTWQPSRLFPDAVDSEDERKRFRRMATPTESVAGDVAVNPERHKPVATVRTNATPEPSLPARRSRQADASSEDAMQVDVAPDEELQMIATPTPRPRAGYPLHTSPRRPNSTTVGSQTPEVWSEDDDVVVEPSSGRRNQTRTARPANNRFMPKRRSTSAAVRLKARFTPSINTGKVQNQTTRGQSTADDESLATELADDSEEHASQGQVEQQRRRSPSVELGTATRAAWPDEEHVHGQIITEDQDVALMDVDEVEDDVEQIDGSDQDIIRTAIGEAKHNSNQVQPKKSSHRSRSPVTITPRGQPSMAVGTNSEPDAIISNIAANQPRNQHSANAVVATGKLAGLLDSGTSPDSRNGTRQTSILSNKDNGMDIDNASNTGESLAFGHNIAATVLPAVPALIPAGIPASRPVLEFISLTKLQRKMIEESDDPAFHKSIVPSWNDCRQTIRGLFPEKQIDLLQFGDLPKFPGSKRMDIFLLYGNNRIFDDEGRAAGFMGHHFKAIRAQLQHAIGKAQNSATAAHPETGSRVIARAEWIVKLGRFLESVEKVLELRRIAASRHRSGKNWEKAHEELMNFQHEASLDNFHFDSKIDPEYVFRDVTLMYMWKPAQDFKDHENVYESDVYIDDEPSDSESESEEQNEDEESISRKKQVIEQSVTANPQAAMSATSAEIGDNVDITANLPETASAQAGVVLDDAGSIRDDASNDGDAEIGDPNEEDEEDDDMIDVALENQAEHEAAQIIHATTQAYDDSSILGHLDDELEDLQGYSMNNDVDMLQDDLGSSELDRSDSQPKSEKGYSKLLRDFKQKAKAMALGDSTDDENSQDLPMSPGSGSSVDHNGDDWAGDDAAAESHEELQSDQQQLYNDVEHAVVVSAKSSQPAPTATSILRQLGTAEIATHDRTSTTGHDMPRETTISPLRNLASHLEAVQRRSAALSSEASNGQRRKSQLPPADQIISLHSDSELESTVIRRRVAKTPSPKQESPAESIDDLEKPISGPQDLDRPINVLHERSSAGLRMRVLSSSDISDTASVHSRRAQGIIPIPVRCTTPAGEISASEDLVDREMLPVEQQASARASSVDLITTDHHIMEQQILLTASSQADEEETQGQSSTSRPHFPADDKGGFSQDDEHDNSPRATEAQASAPRSQVDVVDLLDSDSESETSEPANRSMATQNLGAAVKQQDHDISHPPSSRTNFSTETPANQDPDPNHSDPATQTPPAEEDYEEEVEILDDRSTPRHEHPYHIRFSSFSVNNGTRTLRSIDRSSGEGGSQPINGDSGRMASQARVSGTQSVLTAKERASPVVGAGGRAERNGGPASNPVQQNIHGREAMISDDEELEALDNGVAFLDKWNAEAQSYLQKR